ncbi:ABC transporter ATP-binding protein [Marinicella gelatinilytica]|uniref:ABC transporter ATP-binding protein n=1 Tax=Marinicella gelatinilytica TaxID=2996017 RepID=UPI002260BA21|nr:ABC transporter ATP-binding protein [Marinicella gelatinilytica]MCX7544072.1 ABC transporter ATP-binding protein [Marinicella gelatinilytica]
MPLVEIKNLNKFYPAVTTNKQRVKSMWNILTNKPIKSGVHVLDNISITVKKGESLAIIGRNGAGKSTLLKALSGVIQPTSGEIIVNGSIGALLELGSGFDPEYTGIDNLKMSAALAGIRGQEAKQKIQRMIEFADIGDYIYEPVKNYSSGMVVRLGFAVITETKPQLLITDEALAVGDEFFQRKCLAWLNHYLSDGGTLLLVSHSMYHVQKLAKHAIWLDNGRIRMQGSAYDVSQAYHFDSVNELPGIKAEEVDQSGFHVMQADILSSQHKVIDELTHGDTVYFKVKLFSPTGEAPGLLFGIVSFDNQPVYGVYSEQGNHQPTKIGEGVFEFTLRLADSPLLPGRYHVKFHTMTPDQLQLIDTVEKPLTVKGETREMGVVRLPIEWLS